MKRNVLILAVIIIGAGTFWFTSRDSTLVSNDTLTVATSFYPLYFLASEIAGDRAEVFNVTPAGAEPHDFEPTAGDLIRIAESDILITNGGDIDVWASNVAENVGPPTRILTLGTEFMTLESEGDHEHEGEEEHEKEEGHEGEEYEGEEEEHELDPHIWLSPSIMKRMAEKTLQAFIEADPENASYYSGNAADLYAELEALESEFTNGLAQCVRREFVTSHAAFGYLARDFNLTQVSISGLSPEEEPSAQDLAEITEHVKAEGIPVIFFETLVSPKLSETIAQETGTRTMVLNPLEGLTNADQDAGKNYLTEMHGNLVNLQTALECQK